MNIVSLETLDGLRPVVDFGLLILIWMVQLIVYPSFQFTAASHFSKWHYRYTGLITIFVAPLMFSQTGIYAFSCYLAARWHDFLGMALILVVWLATFFLSVPCHDRLQKQGHDVQVIDRLVLTNWLRTAAWSLMFGIDWYAGLLR